MALAAPEKECPWCAIFLIVGAVLSHTMVLFGNLDAARGFQLMGVSTKGWSRVGLGVADSLKGELDLELTNVTEQLVAGVQEVMDSQSKIDEAIAAIGEAADKSVKLLQLAGPPSVPTEVPSEVNAMLTELVEKIYASLTKMIDLIEPALLKLGQWFTTFGDKLQAGMEIFSTTIDVVQKLFDQIMSQTQGGGENIDYMTYNTFNLFALSNKELGIAVQDLKDVSALYSITPLQGSKAEDLHTTYDLNKDSYLDPTEFEGFVQDEKVPNIMSVVLRSYSKKLAQIGGNVKAARMRDEIAAAVVNYLSLVCAKNLTKVGWVSQALTNGSLPMEFTAGIMKNLALQADDPEAQTIIDVGSLVVWTMMSLNRAYTQKCADKLTDTEFWNSEGFNPDDQPVVVERVRTWQAEALSAGMAVETLIQVDRSVGTMNASILSSSQATLDLVAVSEAARAEVAANMTAYRQRHHASLVRRYERLHSSPAANYLFDNLMGGAMAGADDDMAATVVKAGQPAAPATLEFAEYLSNNATRFAAEFQRESFTYSGQSSSAMDSIATQISGMVKKIQAFLPMLQQYMGPTGVSRLREKVQKFQKAGVNDVYASIQEYLKTVGVSKEDANTTNTGTNTKKKNGSLLLEIESHVDVLQNHTEHDARQLSYAFPDDASLDVSSSDVAAVSLALGEVSSIKPTIPPDAAAKVQELKGLAFLMVMELLDTVRGVLPMAITNIKLARVQVSSVSASMLSVFEVFEDKGQDVFELVSSKYKLLWIVYFVLMVLITMGILYYALWASGVIGGGPKSTGETFFPEYESPTNWRERVSCCWNSCTHCLGRTSETECAFWSMLLLGQVFVLILFLVSVLLVVLAGVKMFITSGCAEVYILGDPTICTVTLKEVTAFLKSFNPGKGYNTPIDEFCVRQELTTCKIMADKMFMSGILTAVGAIAAAIFTFQMLLQSAMMHEQVRGRRLFDKLMQDEAGASGS